MPTLDKILKHLSLISAILIFLSFTNLHLFYSSFGISIYSYLETSELLLSFLPNIFALLFLGTAYIAFFILLAQRISDTGEEKEKREYRKKSLGYYLGFLSFKKLKRIGVKKIPLLLKRIVTSYLFFFLLLTVLTIIGINSGWYEACPKNFIDDLRIYIIFIWAIYLIGVIQTQNYAEGISLIGFVAIIFFALFLVMSFRIDCKVQARKDGKQTKIIEFTYLDQKVSSDDELVFLGNTKGYIFLYHRENEKVFVYKRANIDHLVISTPNE